MQKMQEHFSVFSYAVNRSLLRFSQFPSRAKSQGTQEISRGKTQNFHCVDAEFIKRIPLQMEDFVVTCPLVSNTSHLISDSCPSPRNFGLGFLQQTPRDANLALLLAFGSAITWQEDLHLSSFVPCPAHTPQTPAQFTASEWFELLATCSMQLM